MTKSLRTYGLLFAATLFLAGCGAESPGGSPEEVTSASPTSSSPSEAAPSEEPSASESANAESETYTNEDLTALVSSLMDAKGQPLTVVPAEQVDQALILARTIVESATITPEECRAVASENLQAPEGSTYAAGVSTAAEEMTQTTITVIAVDDPKVMADQLMQAQEAIEACTSYELEFEGETISAEIEPLDVQTEAETSFGSLTTQTLGTGDTQTIMAVSGVQGNLAVSAVKIGAEVPPEAQEELVQLINDALTEAG